MEAGEGIPVGSKVNLFDSKSEQMPDYFEWVLGWKHLILDDDGVAHSGFGDTTWKKGENRATHNGSPGAVGCPHSGSHCGWNVFYEKRHHQMNYGRANVVLRGRGERFAIHPDGFRAEWAEIVCFVGRGPRYKKAGEHYGVPVFKYHWQAEIYLRRNSVLGDYFPEDRRPKGESFFRKEREVDWNEVPMGDMESLLTNGYMIFIIFLWIAVIVGFSLGALNIGGML